MCVCVLCIGSLIGNCLGRVCLFGLLIVCVLVG